MFLNIDIWICSCRYQLEKSKCTFTYIFNPIIAETWRLGNQFIWPVNISSLYIKRLFPWRISRHDKVKLQECSFMMVIQIIVMVSYTCQETAIEVWPFFVAVYQNKKMYTCDPYVLISYLEKGYFSTAVNNIILSFYLCYKQVILVIVMWHDYPYSPVPYHNYTLYVVAFIHYLSRCFVSLPMVIRCDILTSCVLACSIRAFPKRSCHIP